MRYGSVVVFPILLTFLAVWLGARFLLPLFSPFLLGTALALAAEPLVFFLHRKVHLPRTLASGIAVTASCGFLMLIFLLLCGLLVRELQSLAGFLPQVEQAARSGVALTENWLLDLSAHMPRDLQPMLRERIRSAFSDGNAFISRAASWALGLAGTILSNVPDSALGLGTAVLSGYMISAKLPRLRRLILRRIPRQKLRALGATWKQIRSTLGRWFTAQGKLMGLTALILFLGFTTLRIPHALMWALGVCLVDAFPVLGTGTVLLPWSLVLFLQEDTPRAIGILGLYVTVTLSRSILEPRLLGRHLGLDPLAALVALYAGYKLWGIAGMLLSPILAATAMQLVPQREP